MSGRQIEWEAVEPFVAGPYRGSCRAASSRTGSSPAASFDVPDDAAQAFGFGQLEPGPSWPERLPELRRVVALPLPLRPLDARSEDVVLGLRDASGEHAVLCARAADITRWAVDPVEWIEGLLGERYVERWRRPLPSRLPGLNYSLVPHAVKGWLEPLQSPRGGSAARPENAIDFPQLPLDDLVESLRRLCATLACGDAARPDSPWPEGRRAAVTLTHDVDTPWILDPRQHTLLDELLEAEGALGFRGAWYVTAKPLRPERHAAALERIAQCGHEIGSHGWNHDAKLEYVGARRQNRRMQRVLSRFGARRVPGIRTPWNCRSGALLEVLAQHFAYDSSVPNASGFYSAGTNSGCCSVFPYRHASGIVELPATLPPDTSLDPERGYAALAPLADRIVELGGVVALTMHPQPHQSGHRKGIRALADFLEAFKGRHGDALWHATPDEIVRQYELALGYPRRP